MSSGPNLQVVGFVVGVLLVLTHLAAGLRPGQIQEWLKGIPRSRMAGTWLLAVAAVWSFSMVRTMDLGEFSRLREVMLVSIAVGSFLTWMFVPEFLAVRALGMLLLLGAEPMLGAAFMRPEQSRLLVVVLAYGWAMAGLFFVGMPYLLRDCLGWVTANPMRWAAASWGGVLYGVAVLVCAALFW